MPRMKQASRTEQLPSSPSSASSDHTRSPSPRHPINPRFSDPSSSHPVDPEYLQLATRVASQDILKEKPFPLTPATNPFVQQLFALDLAGLAQTNSIGNLTFVHQYYTYARYSRTYGINFRGVSIPDAFSSTTIREHYHLPIIPHCQHSDLLRDYPLEEVISTLCIPGTQWLQPRGSQRYLPRTSLVPLARPWLHFLSNNILPSSHLSNIPKELALYIYLLMTGRPVDLASVISNALRQSVLSTNIKHKLLFPHLISDLFRAFRVPELPADLPFSPAPSFVYVRLSKPRSLPPAQPAPASSSSSSPPPSPHSPRVPPPSPPVLPPVSSPPPIPTPVSPLPSVPPAPSEVALLRADVLRLEAQITASHSLLTLIAAHLGLPTPPPATAVSPAPASSDAAPPDPPAADPAS